MNELLPIEYLNLAKERASSCWQNYTQPEDYGYDFRNWVSPYTKGAHKFGGIAVILQDWSSSDAIGKIPDPEIQEYGRTINLKTNTKLEGLLQRVFGLTIKDVYGTNIFPFIKYGGISNSIPSKDIKKSAETFIKRELGIVKPEIILALGNMPYYGLKSAGIECIHLPHPAARIGSIDKHEKIWLERLKGKNIKP